MATYLPIFSKGMKILYRPQRSTLAEAMQEVKQFNTMEDLIDYLVKVHIMNENKAFRKEDIYIHYYCYDERINWQTYLVCVGKYFNENYLQKYHCPQAIGYLTFIY